MCFFPLLILIYSFFAVKTVSVVVFLTSLSPSESLNMKVILGTSDEGSESRKVAIITVVS